MKMYVTNLRLVALQRRHRVNVGGQRVEHGGFVRDKTILDITLLKDQSLAGLENIWDPDEQALKLWRTGKRDW